MIKGKHLLLYLLLATGCFFSLPVVAQGGSVTPVANCGLLSMRSVLLWYGRDIPVDEIITTRYISTGDGSTLGDLAEAARNFNLEAKAVKNLNLRDLKRTRYPLICSVRAEVNDTAFNHYVVVFPEEGGQEFAYDPLNNRILPVDDLARGMWSGYGLLLSEKPFSSFSHSQKQYLILLLSLSVLMLLRALFTLLSPRWSFLSGQPFRIRCGATFVLLGLFAFCASLCYHAYGTKASLLNFPEKVRGVQERHFVSFLPKVSARYIHKSLEGDRHIVVDARQSQDYLAGHISGAINLSPFSSDEERFTILKDVDKGKSLILYCQSSSCPYAIDLGRWLDWHGYHKLFYYAPGWMEWEQKYPAGEREAS